MIGQTAMNVTNETHLKSGLSRKELLAVVETLRRAVEHWRGLYIGMINPLTYVVAHHLTYPTYYHLISAMLIGNRFNR
jgi:hypothetical protein